MAFDIDIGFASLAGRKDINEDFCAAMLPEARQMGMGSIIAIADGVSTGGMGKEAAQTTVTSLVRDYYGTPETWDITVALDRIISAQNSWLAGINRRRHPVIGLTTLTALVLRGQSYALAHVGDTRAYLMRDGRLTQLTSDHVVDHPDLRHQLLRCVGAEENKKRVNSSNYGSLVYLFANGTSGKENKSSFSAPKVTQAIALFYENTFGRKFSRDYLAYSVVKGTKGEDPIFNLGQFESQIQYDRLVTTTVIKTRGPL